MAKRGVSTAERVTVICPCGKQFTVTRTRYEQGRGRRCSVNCKYKYMTRRSGLTYIKHKDNPTSFKRGQHASPATEFRQGQEAWNKGIPGRIGPDHPQWQGGDISYFALHMWVARNKVRTGTCTRCDAEGRTHWANLSHEYRRDLDDYAEMCQSCAFAYDRYSGYWGSAAGYIRGSAHK